LLGEGGPIKPSKRVFLKGVVVFDGQTGGNFKEAEAS